MGYIQGEGRNQGTLFPVVLDDFVPTDHVCRAFPRPLPGFRSSPKASAATISNTSCPRKGPDPQHHSQASLPAYFLAGRGIGVTPTCSSAVYGAP